MFQRLMTVIVAARVIAGRLLKVIHAVVAEDQTCGVPSRYIGENVAYLPDMVHYAAQSGSPCAILSLDQEKAFDRVDWSFLLATLTRMGFHTSFLRWIRLFYNAVQSAVIVNGHVSNFFSLTQGVRQGCPLASLLYDLVAEVLAANIRANPAIAGPLLPGLHSPISQYADDTLLILSSDASIRAVFDTYARYELGSGSKLNMTKSCSLWLGSWAGRTDPPVPLNWTSSRLKILRVFIGPYDVDKPNWRLRIEAVEHILSSWRQRSLSLGRRLLYSCNGTSSFNPSVIRIVLGGDVHPQPGPSRTAPRCSSTARSVASELDVFLKNTHANIKIAHLNVRSLKSRENFILVKDSIQSIGFDMFTISETWLDSSVTDASVYVSGYSMFRQDCGPQKAGAGLCVYTRDTLKVEYIENLSSVTSDGLQQLWLKVEMRSCKSFLLNTVYRPPSTPVKFLDDLTRVFIDSLLRGLDIFVISDLNCNLLSEDYESRAFSDFCTTLNLTQLIKSPTRITESSQSLIDVIMTTNKEIIASSGVLTSSISDYNLIYLLLDLKVLRARPSYVSIRSYKNYNFTKFLEDLQLVPFHMVNFFEDISDQVDMYGILFLDVLNEHAPIKRIKIKAKPNPFVSPEIKQLMKTCNNWHKSAMKTNDKLHWNAYKFFRQEVKREIRLAERIYVKSQIINSKGNTNSI